MSAALPTPGYTTLAFTVGSTETLSFELLTGEPGLFWSLEHTGGPTLASGPATAVGEDLGAQTLLPGNYVVRFEGVGSASFEARQPVAVSESLAVSTLITPSFNRARDSVTAYRKLMNAERATA